MQHHFAPLLIILVLGTVLAAQQKPKPENSVSAARSPEKAETSVSLPSEVSAFSGDLAAETEFRNFCQPAIGRDGQFFSATDVRVRSFDQLESQFHPAI